MGFLIFVGVWIVGAIWGYRRAVASGYSELVAALGALMLGPLAPLLGVVKPRGKKCAFCASIIPTEASVCPKCTRDQPRPAPVAAPPPAETEAQRRARVADKIRADENARAERLREVERKHGAGR